MTSATLISNSQSSPTLKAARRIMRKFLADMAYTTLKINPYNKELEDFMIKTMDSRNLRCKQLEKTVHLAASFIQLCYPDISMEEKKIASLFNWFLIYVDDQVSRDPTPIRHFEQHFIRGLPHQDPVMDALVDVLNEIWEKWDDITANLIIGSALHFTTCCCIETTIENGLALVPGNSRFAWFLREGSGVAKPYSTFGFTKSKGLGATDYIQVIPDMDYWVAVTNDLLSFYKEALHGETNNYVHTRARNEKKTVVEVLSDIEEELVESRNVIHSALANNPLALKAWIATEQGYIQWHLTQERYKLSELGLVEASLPKPVFGKRIDV